MATKQYWISKLLIKDAEITRLEAENQAMAELLDQAPHHNYCGAINVYAAECDCWKREAQRFLVKS